MTPLLAITTVGYGEITPRSFLGRVITVPLLVFGLLLIALPTFVLGREFSVVWDLMKENRVSSNPLVHSYFNLSLIISQVQEEEEYVPTPHASPIVRNANRSTWDLRLDSLAAEAIMPPSEVNRRHANRDRAELSSQIADLKATVEMQGEMIKRMMEMMDCKGKQRAEPEDGNYART